MTWRPKLTEQPSSRKLSVSVPEGKRTLQGLNPTGICSGPEIAHVTHSPLARTSHIHSPAQTKEVKKYQLFQVAGTGTNGNTWQTALPHDGIEAQRGKLLA